jgi:DMSO/TMAO reductase YedYZ molybdopterin-dependent catalytic subunit
LAILLPRGRSSGGGPNEFQVNKTAVAAGIGEHDIGPDWRLRLHAPGRDDVVLSRAELLAMPLRTATLPIACVEGWATSQSWTGVRLAHLAALSGLPDPAWAHVRSLQRDGSFNRATLQRNQVLDPDALLALRVNGADLSADHGYPARIIVPALPGVHNTKWVASISFGSA